VPKLIVMVGESGSGKSTRANEILAEGLASGRKIVRVNMDNIREMFFGKDSSWDIRLKGHNAKLVGQVEKHCATLGLNSGFDVIIDDINLSDRAQNSWKQFAGTYDEVELEFVRMDTPFEVCVQRDAARHGREHVGRAVIERQFLTSGRAQFGTKPIVICDLDGTLFGHEGVRSPFDETQVHRDWPYTVVMDWVDELAKDNSIVLVSGRHASCGDGTMQALANYGVPYDHLLMRNSGDNRPDTVVKQELLNGMLKCGVTKKQITCVLDDRPKVIRMWKENGLKVYPVRGQVEEF